MGDLPPSHTAGKRGWDQNLMLRVKKSSARSSPFALPYLANRILPLSIRHKEVNPHQRETKPEESILFLKGTVYIVATPASPDPAMVHGP